MSIFSAGLVSITFRRLAPDAIVELARSAGLTDIEWGGDVHAPHGDVDAARRIRRLTEDAGLRTAAYGSYYRVASTSEQSPAFDAVLSSACALGAPVIRVWAGSVDSAAASEAYLDEVASDAHRIASLAADAGVRVAFEYHGGTVADRAASALALLKRAAHPNLSSLWQPSVSVSKAERAANLRMILPHLSHVHVFQWNVTARLPLAAGENEWPDYLAILKSRQQPTALLIEFVQNDDPKSFLGDAATLRNWISQT